MPDVFVVEARKAIHGSLERVGFAHVPVGHQLLAVGVGVDAEDDVVVQNAHGFRVSAAHQLIDRLHQLLGPNSFGCVQTTVNPDDSLAVVRKLFGLGFGHALGCGQSADDGLVLGEILDVLGRGDDCHVVRPTFGGLADFDQFHTVGFDRKLLPVGFQLGVGRHLVVVTDVEAERGFGRGDLWGRKLRCCGRFRRRGRGGGFRRLLRIQQGGGKNC